MGRFHLFSHETSQGTRTPTITMKLVQHITLPDIPVVHAIQRNTSETHRSKTTSAVSQPSSTEWCTSTSIRCLCIHINCDRSSFNSSFCLVFSQLIEQMGMLSCSWRVYNAICNYGRQACFLFSNTLQLRSRSVNIAAILIFASN